MTGELRAEPDATVGERGEDAVLALIRERIDAHNARVPAQRMLLGPGDDAAVVTFGADGGGAPVVMTTDTLSEGQDFRLSWWDGVDAPEGFAAAECIGVKAAAQNLSDLNAMGAAPVAMLISLMLPAPLPGRWVQDFYRGVERACRRPGAEGCLIAGGDLSSAEQITVSITALGELPGGREPLPRSGARNGDVLALCGGLGDAAAGLALLEHDRGLSGAQGYDDLLRAQLRPDPPLHAGRMAAEAGATAAMDISDGLLRDAGRLARASGTTILLDDAAVQAEARRLEDAARSVQPGRRSCRTAMQWVLNGGEEYALLATFPRSAQLPEGFRTVGTVAEADRGASGGVQTRLTDTEAGWDSLSR